MKTYLLHCCTVGMIPALFLAVLTHTVKPSDTAVNARVAALEKRTGGRLGAAALDTGSGKRIEYRSEERFAMCSTFKFLLAAAVLARVDENKDFLDRRVPYGAADLLEYAPVTREHLTEGGMTLSALCAAAIEYSDNTAANLLLNIVGGPQGLTRYLRSLGDSVTRLERNEPSLNSNTPGDVRDTTSPAAMLNTMARLLCGSRLSSGSRLQLEDWLVGCTTGAARLRAGFPSGWRVGDKTGTGANNAISDIAIAWPPGKSPILAAVYLTDSRSARSEGEAIIAEVGKIIASEFSQ